VQGSISISMHVLLLVEKFLSSVLDKVRHNLEVGMKGSPEQGSPSTIILSNDEWSATNLTGLLDECERGTKECC